MVKGISDLVSGLMMIFPPWVLVGLGVVGLVTLGPGWVESVRDKELRGLVRRLVRADPEERRQLTDRVLQIAGQSPRRLASVVQHAIHYDQRALRDLALAALEAAGTAPEDARRLRAKIERAPLRFRDPLEAAVRIEQLLESGLDQAAEEHLTAALAAFPGDPELVALSRRSRETGSGEP